MKRFVLLVPLMFLLAGCGLFLSGKDKALQKDPNYRSGYGDGCAAANAENTDYRNGGGARDEELFASNKAYRSGWHSGFSACRSGYTQQPGTQRSPLPGGGPIH